LPVPNVGGGQMAGQTFKKKIDEELTLQSFCSESECSDPQEELDKF
jgi:hypothetical protein